MNAKAVVLACDAGYAPYAMVVACGIAAAHPDRDFDICLCSSDPLAIPAALAWAGVRMVRLGDNPFAHGPDAGRHGAAAYLRLMMPDLLAGDYRRILYLDSDIVVSGGGIGRLLDIDLGGRWIGAVRDNLQWRTPGRRTAEFRAMGRPALPYFNSGVMLIDTAGWVAAGVGARAQSLFREHGARMTRHDQSLLNLIADGNWAELSPVWNWQYTWSSRFFADLAEPRLMHFIGARKPWKDRDATLPARFRAPYAGIAADWPEMAPPDMAPPSVPAWPPRLGRAFLKHALATARMRAYLARFPDPFIALPADQARQ